MAKITNSKEIVQSPASENNAIISPSMVTTWHDSSGRGPLHKLEALSSTKVPKKKSLITIFTNLRMKMVIL
jgi:hypothetical protein